MTPQNPNSKKNKITKFFLIICINFFLQNNFFGQQQESSKPKFYYVPSTFKYQEAKNNVQTPSTTSIYDFTKLKVSCPNDSLITKINYTVTTSITGINYSCFPITDNFLILSNVDSGWNEVFSNTNKSAHYLDRHTLACGKNQILNSFVLQKRDSDGYIRYEGVCASVNQSLLDCQTVLTPYQTLVDWTNLNLNGLTMGSGKRFIQRFKLNIVWNENSSNKIWFEYDECMYKPINDYIQ